MGKSEYINSFKEELERKNFSRIKKLSESSKVINMTEEEKEKNLKRNLRIL